MNDDIDDLRQPQCPECGTVLYDVRGGYECRGCQLRFFPTVDDPAARA